jgi:hypothetical protein
VYEAVCGSVFGREPGRFEGVREVKGMKEYVRVARGRMELQIGCTICTRYTHGWDARNVYDIDGTCMPCAEALECMNTRSSRHAPTC